MKILYIVNVCHNSVNGSAPPFVMAQIDSVKRTGNHVAIYTIKGNLSKWNYLKSFLEVRKLVREKCFDIVHAHYSYSGLVAALQRKVPVIISFMGSDLFGSYNSNGKLKLRGHVDVWFSRILQHLVDGIVVKSEGMRKFLTGRAKCIVQPNGVNFELFREMPIDQTRKRMGLDFKKKIILFIGDQKNQNKGFPIVNDAVNLLRTTDANIQLLSVHGIEHDVIPYYMNASNVLVLASIMEGSPNVVKEAMACNLPIVATGVGDIKEMIFGVSGCKIVKRNKNAIAKGIREVLENFQRTNGRKAIEHLSLEHVASRLIAFYQQILESKTSCKTFSCPG